MASQAGQALRELILNDRRFIESLFVVETKQRKVVPFHYNNIQVDVDSTETGMDIWVKPAQVGFSTERIAKRLKDTLTSPGTNTVLIAYEDFITERLLSKVQFFYNHLQAKNIPGFPELFHNSTYEKTFRFYVNSRIYSTSSIYIASARSYVAGRAETIHHLLCDEFAFYPPNAMENIISPALDRVPSGGTVDVYSTPNGEENGFYDMYSLAKEGKSVFTPHFYPWFMHKEYVIGLGDLRIERFIPETNKPEFKLSNDEENLAYKGLTFDQIRWRRWKIREKESLRRSGKMALLFQQEFPEDDVSCLLSTGNMLFEDYWLNKLAKECHPANRVTSDGLEVWYEPEKGKSYIVSIDPGQAKVTQSAITVLCYDQSDGNYIPKYCARDAGLYSPEITTRKAVVASDLYNRAIIVWEANSHGLAITELLKRRRPIYFRRDIISGMPSMEPGWFTTSKNRDYLFQQVSKFLPDLICHDIELVKQIKNHKLVGDKVEVVGFNDIFMSFAIGLCCHNPKPMKRGFIGRSGWRW